MEKLFLNKNLNLYKFDGNYINTYYIINIDNRNFIIDEISFNIICFIKEGIDNLDEIINIFSNKYNLSLEKIKKIILKKIDYLKKISAISNNNNFKINIENKKSYNINFKMKIIGEKTIEKVSFFLKFLFNKYISKFLILIILMVFIYQFKFIKDYIIILKNININILIYFTILNPLATLFHEFGHCTAAKICNLKIKEIGIGIYYFNIVAYSDVNRTWLLNKKCRLLIDAGGYYFTLIFSLFVFIIGIFLNYKILIFYSFYKFISVFNGLNVFLKYDGYWLFTDLIGVFNLSDFVINYLKSLFKKRKNPLNNLNKNGKKYFFIYFFLLIIYFIFFIYSIYLITLKIMPDYIIYILNNIKLILISLYKINITIIINILLKFILIIFYIYAIIKFIVFNLIKFFKNNIFYIKDTL